MRWLCWSLLLLLGSTAFTQTQVMPLRYELWWEEWRTLSVGTEPLSPENAPLLSRYKLPPLQAPKFFVYKFVDGERLFAVTEQDGQLVLYADTDGDNDLTDERPFGLRQKGRAQVFGPIPMRFRVEGKTVLQHIAAQFWQAEGESGLDLVIVSRRTGTILWGGKPTPVYLWDGDINGAFDESDPLVIGDEGEGELQYLAPNICVGMDEQFFRLKVLPTGEQLIVEPLQISAAKLRFQGEKLTLGLENEQGRWFLEGHNGELLTPVGEFRLLRVELTTKDNAGRVWTLSAVAAGPAAPKLVIPKEGTTLPSLTPLRVSLLWHETSAKEGEFSLEIKTANGMVVNRIMVDNRFPPEPKLRLATADGKVIDEPQFHYG